MILCLSASRIYNTFSVLTRSRKKKKIGSCSISFLVHPGWSPGILLCLSASRIYSSSLTRRKNKVGRSFCRRYISVFVCVSNVIDFNNMFFSLTTLHNFSRNLSRTVVECRAFNYISRPRMMTWWRENWRLYRIRCEIWSEILKWNSECYKFLSIQLR